jgi:hypothetical protein
MLISLSISWPAFSPFERDILLGEVNSDEGDADWIAAAAFELRYLIIQVVNDAIDLLDHRFGENLCFRTDLDRCHWTACDEHSLFDHCYCRRNQLAKCPIATSRRLASHYVL